MNWIRKYFGDYKKLLAISLVLAATNQIFSLLDPQLFRMIVDTYVTNVADYTQDEFLRGVGLLLLGMIVVAMVSRIAKNFQDYFVNVMTQKIGMRVYQDSLQHAFSLPYASFEDQQSGQLLLKLQKVRQDIQKFLADVINILFLSAVGLSFVIIYSMTVHWLLGTYFLLLIPVMGWTLMVMSAKIREAQQVIVRDSSDLAGATTETVRNVSIVKSLGLQEQEMGRLESANQKILGLELKKIKMLRFIEFWQGTLINIMRIMLMATMFWFVYDGVISIGEFFTLFFYSFFVFAPLRQSSQLINSYQEARASHDILQEILSREPEKKPINPHAVGDDITSLSFDQVSFGYVKGKHVLHDISFEAREGEMVAFVGPSGAGKSTIVKLLTGLYHPQKGKVSVNDHSLTAIDIEAMRLRLGLVSQDAQLFAGTIRDNLLFVKPDASDAECLQVLEDAQILDLLSQGIDGLDTKIGEGGLKLSGGQKQRLAIARALLRDPEVLLFDEATSSLDSLVEEEITKTIKKVAKKRPKLIMIAIAHRLSTVSHADRIYVLEQGVVIEQGKHQDLLQKPYGLYQAMWRQQTGS